MQQRQFLTKVKKVQTNFMDTYISAYVRGKGLMQLKNLGVVDGPLQ